MNCENTSKFKQTEIGPIPEGWEVKTVAEIAEIILGGTPKTSIEEFWNGDIKWASAKDISNCKLRYIYETEKTVTAKGIKNSAAKVLPKNTIVLTSRGTVGKLVLLPEPMSFNQTCYGIQAKENIDALFLYYNLKNAIEYLKSLSYGTVFSTITKRTFEELKLGIPKYGEQQAIAHSIGTLDQKIELNHSISHTLEAIAQAIFKRWFVDFEFPNEHGEPYKSSGGEMVYNEELGKEIPKEWEVGNIGHIAEIIMGVSPKGASYNTTEKGLPLLNGAADFSDDRLVPKKYTTEPTRVCEIGDIIFCIRGTIGNLTFSNDKYCLGRGVAAISSKDKVYKEFIYFTLKQHLSKMITQAAGSVIIGLKKDDISNLTFALPLKSVISYFHKAIKPLFSLKQLFTEETESLETIRDALLPKLMSGEIRVIADNAEGPT
ncbi:MAG: restriction endonuclease subunit S [Candidatus Thermoplasmatota archaeon]|nr:restriction endonuclease subunit S [Candidatus Thermoplasmatota archaeon]